jgi:hypothetical protein
MGQITRECARILDHALSDPPPVPLSPAKSREQKIATNLSLESVVLHLHCGAVRELWVIAKVPSLTTRSQYKSFNLATSNPLVVFELLFATII